MTSARPCMCYLRGCLHFWGFTGPAFDPTYQCAAYPLGIPEDIVDGTDPHSTPRGNEVDGQTYSPGGDHPTWAPLLGPIEKGGPTSGNWGHTGYPGRGGSSSGGHAALGIRGGHSQADILGIVTLRRRATGSKYPGAQAVNPSEVTAWRGGLAKKAAAYNARLNKERLAQQAAKEPTAPKRPTNGQEARAALEDLAKQHEPGIAKLKATADVAYEESKAARTHYNAITHRVLSTETEVDERGRHFRRYIDAPRPGIDDATWEAARIRKEEAAKVSNDAHKPLVEARLAFIDAQRAAVAVDNPMSINHKYRARFKNTPEEIRRQATWDAGRMGFENLVSADLQPTPMDVDFKKGGRGRSFQSGRLISLAKGCGAATVCHELGHRLEEVNPKVKRSATAFLEYRTSGERERSLRAVAGSGYRRDERTRVDKFMSAYMGKSYGFGGTEIVSMGLDYMYGKPLDFARGDPGMFDMIYNLSRGIEWEAP